MPQPADLIDQPHGLGYAKLGTRFWVLWWIGFIAINVVSIGALVFTSGLMFAAPDSAGLGGTIALGAITIIYCSALIAYCIRPMRVLQKRGLEGKMRRPYRLYMLRFLPAMFGYVILLMGALIYMQEAKPAGVMAWLAGLAPSVPVLFAIRAVVMLPRDEDDEFLRAGIYEAGMMATGGTLAICTVYGFLDLFSLVPHVQLWAVFPIWAVCLGCAQVVRARRFR